MADTTAAAAVASSIGSLIFMCAFIFCIYRCCKRTPHTVIYNYGVVPTQPPPADAKAMQSMFFDRDLAKRLADDV